MLNCTDGDIKNNIMFFKKEFVFTKEQGLKLVNENDAKRYIADKVRYFSKAENYLNKEARLTLLGEIIAMCDYDEVHATFDYSQYPNMQGTNLSDMRTKMIQWYNIAYILGGIYLDVFDCEENRIKDIEDGISGLISTKEMFTTLDKGTHEKEQ